MTEWAIDHGDVRILEGDARTRLAELPDESVHCIVTSPPFWGLRDYGVDGQIGLEQTPEEWADELVGVFRECRRVLRSDGTFFLEVGDTYMGGGGHSPNAPSSRQREEEGFGMKGSFKYSADPAKRGVTGEASKPKRAPGYKPKDLVGAPWLLAFALRADGWWLRAEDIWDKPNAMPESATDRPTRSHSTVFMLSKSPRYFFDGDAERTEYKMDDRKVTTVKAGPGSAQHRDGERWPGKGANVRSVWRIPTDNTSFAHHAVMAQEVARKCISLGTPEAGVCAECDVPWERGAGKMLLWVPGCGCLTLETKPAIVLDPFMGAATTALVARALGRHSIGVELNPESIEISVDRLKQMSLLT